jgi:hypothetical protein
MHGPVPTGLPDPGKNLLCGERVPDPGVGGRRGEHHAGHVPVGGHERSPGVARTDRGLELVHVPPDEALAVDIPALRRDGPADGGRASDQAAPAWEAQDGTARAPVHRSGVEMERLGHGLGGTEDGHVEGGVEQDRGGVERVPTLELDGRPGHARDHVGIGHHDAAGGHEAASLADPPARLAHDLDGALVGGIERLGRFGPGGGLHRARRGWGKAGEHLGEPEPVQERPDLPQDRRRPGKDPIDPGDDD